MASSQEQITEKYFNIIEKALQDTIAKENTKSLLREYKDILLDEIKIQKDHETIMQENLTKATSIGDPALEIKCVKLQETVQDSEKYIDQLKDEMDNLTIQSIADRDTLKIANVDREQQIFSHYENEGAQLGKQLEDDKRKHENIEQEIKNQITLEIATNNARLGEIRGNLKRQIVERNTVLIKMQNEQKELRKELNLLKAHEKLNSKQDKNINPKPSNIMEFHNEFLIPKNPTNIPHNRNKFNNNPLELKNYCNEVNDNNEFNNDRNESNKDPNKFNNICQPGLKSTISKYSTTQTENPGYHEFAKSFSNLTANTFGQLNTNLDKHNIRNCLFTDNQNSNTNVSNNEQVSSTFSGRGPSTSVFNGINSNKNNRLSNKEMNNDCNEFNNDRNESNSEPNMLHSICQPRIKSPISEYNTTETENPEYHEFANSFGNLAANTFGPPCTTLDKQNIRNWKFNHSQNYNSNVSNSKHVSSRFSPTIASTSEPNGNNSNKNNRLSNKEMTYFAEEYDQFNETQSNFITDIDTVNSKILELVPNPWSTVKMTGHANVPRNKTHASLPKLKKCKIEAQSSSKPVRSSELNDTLVIEDPDMPGGNLISKSFNYETNSLDVERKGPTVYVGEARKKKTYRQAYGFLPKKNYEERGTTLNAITESTAQKRK